MRFRALVLMQQQMGERLHKLSHSDTPGGERGAQLFVCFLNDVFKLGDPMLDTDCFISYVPHVDEDVYACSVSDCMKLKSPPSRDMGRRFGDTFAELFKSNYRQIIVVRDGILDLPRDYVDKAFSLLLDYDAVICPSEDGAYDLFGLSTYPEGLFDDLGWRQDDLFDTTIAKIQDANLKVAVLPNLNNRGGLDVVYQILKRMGDEGEQPELRSRGGL